VTPGTAIAHFYLQSPSLPPAAVSPPSRWPRPQWHPKASHRLLCPHTPGHPRQDTGIQKAVTEDHRSITTVQEVQRGWLRSWKTEGRAEQSPLPATRLHFQSTSRGSCTTSKRPCQRGGCFPLVAACALIFLPYS